MDRAVLPPSLQNRKFSSDMALSASSSASAAHATASQVRGEGWGNTAVSRARDARAVCLGLLAPAPIRLAPGDLWEGATVLTPRPVALDPRSCTKAGTLETGCPLNYVVLRHPNGSRAKVYLHGATVASYIDAEGYDWLQVRPDANLDGAGAIEGGLAPFFPQYGPDALAFARAAEWSVQSATRSAVTLELRPSEASRAHWDKPFRCVCAVDLRAASLDVRFVVENTAGAGGEGFDFQAALRSHVRVSGVDRASIRGDFQDKRYVDHLSRPPGAQATERRTELYIGKPYDRVYPGVRNPVVKDLRRRRQLSVRHVCGFEDVAVRNPFGDTPKGYATWIGLDAVAPALVALAPGESWSGEVSLAPQHLEPVYTPEAFGL